MHLRRALRSGGVEVALLKQMHLGIAGRHGASLGEGEELMV